MRTTRLKLLRLFTSSRGAGSQLFDWSVLKEKVCVYDPPLPFVLGRSGL